MIRISQSQEERLEAANGARILQPCEEEIRYFRIRLLDLEGDPESREHYKIEWPDGHVDEGRLDDEGKVTLPVREGNPTVQFPFRYPNQVDAVTGHTSKL